MYLLTQLHNVQGLHRYTSVLVLQILPGQDKSLHCGGDHKFGFVLFLGLKQNLLWLPGNQGGFWSKGQLGHRPHLCISYHFKLLSIFLLKIESIKDGCSLKLTQFLPNLNHTRKLVPDTVPTPPPFYQNFEQIGTFQLFEVELLHKVFQF